VRLTDNPTVSNALSSRWAAGDKDDARQAEGRRRQRVYNLAVNRYGGANLFSIRPLWKKSLDGGGPPPPIYRRIQRSNAQTWIPRSRPCKILYPAPIELWEVLQCVPLDSHTAGPEGCRRHKYRGYFVWVDHGLSAARSPERQKLEYQQNNG
jgi:hypothetical protein